MKQYFKSLSTQLQPTKTPWIWKHYHKDVHCTTHLCTLYTKFLVRSDAFDTDDCLFILYYAPSYPNWI